MLISIVTTTYSIDLNLTTKYKHIQTYLFPPDTLARRRQDMLDC